VQFALLYHHDPTQAGPGEGEVSDWLAFATTKAGAVATTGNVIAGLYVVDVADADAAQDWA
jgi:hypothetical protein